mmetsp:Transcript_71639/g.158420  ORF Transcript_71639/g.158420 Transcript_71639/m.158420 type:complete len:252 (-) Transcript_71639:945-1700(-)
MELEPILAVPQIDSGTQRRPELVDVLPEPLREKDGIRICLHGPIVLCPEPIRGHLFPDGKEDIRVRDHGVAICTVADRKALALVHGMLVAFINAHALGLPIVRHGALAVPVGLGCGGMPLHDGEAEERCPLNFDARLRCLDFASLARASQHGAVPIAGWCVQSAPRKVLGVLVARVAMARCEFDVALDIVAAFRLAAILPSVRTFHHRWQVRSRGKHCVEHVEEVLLLTQGATVRRIESIIELDDLHRGTP